MTGLTRPDLQALPAYVPGRTIPGAIKLASNEVPFGPLPGVTEAITEAIGTINRYPDMGVTALRQALADRLGVDAARIATGCGSVALAECLVRATCLSGDQVVYSWRSFEAYPIIVSAAGATRVPVPNTPEHGHDLPAMAKAIGADTRAVLVCNPNNPTGTALGEAELTDFLDRVPQDVLVVLDEAYREFVTDRTVPDGLAAFGDRPNVVVLRTFSKAWGLAGLRVGYLIGRPEVVSAVQKVVTPFSTSAVAQAAASAALRAESEMRRRVDQVTAERARVFDSLRGLTPEVPASQSNFLWLPLGERTGDCAAACERAGVVVRPFAGEGVRVTVGSPEENDTFLTAYTAWHHAGGPA